LLSKTGIWSAPAKRSGDGALDLSKQCSACAPIGEAGSKAPSPLRFAGALQIPVLLSKQLCCYYFSFQNLRPYVH